MMDATKYHVGYYPPPVEPGHVYEWPQKDHIEKAPAWCSVDLRDGNQSLIVPMNLEEKLEFYDMLIRIGFKEIEVGFPAASETEYDFLRALIDGNRIPNDVTVQVLTQCRDHIIRKTFEAVKGAPRAIIHFYNSTSVAQREQVFKKSKEEIKQIAVDGAKLVKKLSEEYEGNFLFEYSPESFTGTEVDYAVEVCNAVLDIMQPTPERPMIINLPVTVEMSMPHVYANQIEYCDKHLKYRDSVIISTHPHNDRGTGVACAELAVLAGAQRVECCLFGNGERTGNVDAVTLAMNMYSHGVDPKLDFSNMPDICATYERVTRMHIYERTPYAGQLVFGHPAHVKAAQGQVGVLQVCQDVQLHHVQVVGAEAHPHRAAAAHSFGAVVFVVVFVQMAAQPVQNLFHGVPPQAWRACFSCDCFYII